MFAHVPKFTPSELHAITQAIKDAKKEWLGIQKHLPDDAVKEITEEYDEILRKLEVWRKEDHGLYTAMKSIEESCRLQKREREAKNGN